MSTRKQETFYSKNDCCHELAIRKVSVMFIHPSLHMKLEKILLRTAGATHLAHIDYYLSEYYRVKYRANRPRIDMVALQEFAHRALRIENVSTVLNVLLDPDALEAIHGQGLGLVLRDILERTECALADLKRINRPKPLASVSQEVMLQIEIARCLQELSYYELAIAKLDQPEQLSKYIPDCEEKRRMQENIYLIRGISFWSLGDRVESMKAYLSILILMKEGNQVDHLGTEALGYISLMMVFEEPDKAENLGKLAVDLAEKAGNSRILAKNACSLASIFLFSGQRELADQYLNIASEQLALLTVNPEIPERSRLLLVKAMRNLEKNDVAETGKDIDEARRINNLVGNRRRYIRAQGLYAILLWKRCEKDKAKEILEEIIAANDGLADKVYLRIEALRYALLQGAQTLGDAFGLAKQPEYDGELWSETLKEYERIGDSDSLWNCSVAIFKSH